MSRGPKAKTGENSLKAPVIRRDDLAPPSRLNPRARAEYRRLVAVLEAKGTLERVDLAVLAECARTKALLDQAHKIADVADPNTIRVVNVLTTQRRGLLRELGLTLHPSKSRHTSRPVDGEQALGDPWAGKLKIG